MVDAPTRVAPSVRHVDVAYGDTVQAIALREMGDASRWADLVVLNGLRPPYIAAVGDLGVLAYGDPIKIPVAGNAAAADQSPAELFGTDLQTDKNGALTIENGDFALVSGIPNLSAALARRVQVPKRELAFHPEFGCFVRSLLGRVNRATANQLAAFYVRSSLLEDPRVAAVPRCEAEAAGDRIMVEALVTPISGKPAELKVLI